MLHTFVNIRHFKIFSWDAQISVDYGPLYVAAYAELEFWSVFILNHNFRPFVDPPPAWLAWTDASDFAIAAFAVRIKGMISPCFSADNWLLADKCKYTIVRHCAQLQMDTLPWTGRDIVVRDHFDLDKNSVQWTLIAHRNLDFDEKIKDSNERELMAIVHFLTSALPHIKNSTVTLHVDNTNAALISSKGSNKPRLNAYAVLISEICCKNNINLKTVWIPRDLNNVADFLSKNIDYEDYSVSMSFFEKICIDLKLTPSVDLFADDKNSKTEKFFSLCYCPNTLGADAFNYDWSLNGLNWIFPPPRLILKVLRHMQLTKAEGLLLIPQWKTSYFYPVLNNLRNTRVVQKIACYSGKNVFISGTDIHSYFGPNYSGNVEVWHLNFM